MKFRDTRGSVCALAIHFLCTAFNVLCTKLFLSDVAISIFYFSMPDFQDVNTRKSVQFVLPAHLSLHCFTHPHPIGFSLRTELIFLNSELRHYIWIFPTQRKIINQKQAPADHGDCVKSQFLETSPQNLKGSMIYLRSFSHALLPDEVSKTFFDFFPVHRTMSRQFTRDSQNCVHEHGECSLDGGNPFQFSPDALNQPCRKLSAHERWGVVPIPFTILTFFACDSCSSGVSGLLLWSRE